MNRPKVDFHRDWNLGPYILFPEYAGMKALARAATVRAVREAQRGDDSAALRDLDLALRLALWAEQEPTTISMLVRIACEAILLDGAERCLVAAKGDAVRIRRYAAWLGKKNPPPDFRYALRGEAWMGVASGRNLDRFGGVEVFSKSQPRDLSRLRQEGFPPGTKNRAYLTRVLQAWTEAAQETNDFRIDPLELGRKMDAIEERWSQKKGVSRDLVMILFPVFGKAGKAIVGLEAKRNVALGFAEALEVQARNGHWPSSVSLIDPFTQKPIQVRFDAKGFRVYSVGKDGKDDHGLHRREAPKTEGATFDEVAAYPPVPYKKV